MAVAMMVASFQVSAQVTVKSNGFMDIGENPDSLIEQLEAFYNRRDTISALRLFGPGEQGMRARISFGDAMAGAYKFVMVGEMENYDEDFEEYADTDQLWLHGSDGVYYTRGWDGTDTVFYYDIHKGSAMNFRCNVKTTGVFISSDSRFKENVETLDGARESLARLRGVSYRLKPDAPGGHGDERWLTEPLPGESDKIAKKRAEWQQLRQEEKQGGERFGFLAQEVKEVYPELVETGKDGYMYVDYIGMIPLLVNAVNELGSEVDALRAENESKDEQIERMREQMSAQSGDGGLATGARLYQNTPNPFTSATVIRCDLPAEVLTAQVLVFDLQGQLLRTINVAERGVASVTINGSDLNAGMYIYSLVADGREIDTKRMILTK